VRWMYTHWQKRQYMTPWDENGLCIWNKINAALVSIRDLKKRLNILII